MTLSRVLSLAFAVLMGLPGCGSGTPDALGGPVAMRRLTPDQYRAAISDVFGPEIEIAGRFEPENRSSGLNAVGSTKVAVTPSGFEQYEAMSDYIATQVVSAEHRERTLPCKPVQETARDDQCTRTIVEAIGLRLLRRPLTEDEIVRRVMAAGAAADAASDFHEGVELALITLLVSPDFLFRVEIAEPDANHPDRLVISDFTLASRLSYFLTNRGPDDALLAAAKRGDLSTDEGLALEVDRLLASNAVAGGTRAFFEDLFRFDEFEILSKDASRFPLYNSRLAADAKEQTLRFVVAHLVEQKADYRELFTSRTLPMTPSLGPLYGVPVRVAKGWADSQLPPQHPRAGLLSHASLNMLHAHAGRSSPTLRGVFLREALLCQDVPEAPADVEFALFNQDDNPEYRTARDRLGVHATESSCRNCHKLTDPIGLGLEVFDGIGRYRTTENDAPIDPSGELDGQPFANPVELGLAFASSDLVSACLVQNLYRYSVGRPQVNSERGLLRHLESRFAESEYRLHALMREIVLSDGFRTASRPHVETDDPPAPSATPNEYKGPEQTQAGVLSPADSLLADSLLLFSDMEGRDEFDN